MGQSNQSLVGRWSRSLRRRLNSRGATLVEYSLVLSALVVVSIPAAQWITEEGSAEVANQASCVSQRPPPSSCLIPAITTSTATVPPSITTTTAGIPTTTAPPPPPSAAAWGTATATRTSSTSWYVNAPISVTNSGTPVAGAVVQVRIQIVTPAAGTFYSTCVTDPAGACTINWVVPITNATQVRLTPTQITAYPPVTTLPSSLLFTCNNSSPTSCA